MTTHIAGLTVEAVRELVVSAAQQILQVLRGERPPHLLTPEVWERLQQRTSSTYA